MDPQHLNRFIDNYFWKGPKAEHVKAKFEKHLIPQQGFFGMKRPELTREEFEQVVGDLRGNSNDILTEEDIEKFEQKLREYRGWQKQEPPAKDAA